MKIMVENITPFLRTYELEIMLGLCIVILVHFLKKAMKTAKSNSPPGPMGLPIVGYLPFLTKNAHLDFMQLGKKYGDVFSVKLGSKDFVILQGADVITEALSKPAFLGRPPDSIMNKIIPSSIFFSGNFHLWKEQNRVVVQFIKDLGFGKTKIEGDIMEEINHFMDFLRNTDTQPMDIRKPLCFSVSNNICSLVFGKRFQYDDPKIEFLHKNMEEYFKKYNEICLEVMFSWILYIPFVSNFLQSNEFRTERKKLDFFFQKELNEHLQIFDPASIGDFMSRYLVEIDKQKEKNPGTSFNQNTLINCAIDLFLTGSETVEASLLWFIYIFAAFPDVQKKIQKEIMEVIGTDKTPEYMDRRYMPYTYAVMLEIMRWMTITPVSLLHYTLDDTTVDRYSLKKGTTTLINLWAVHHDPRYWDKPEVFKPERFLSADGKSVIKPSYFMPFLVGRRSCPGESMANMEQFLYTVCILREFNIVFPKETQPNFKGNLALIYRPEPYLVRFIPRK